jgi:hypothetical protein
MIAMRETGDRAREISDRDAAKRVIGMPRNR